MLQLDYKTLNYIIIDNESEYVTLTGHLNQQKRNSYLQEEYKNKKADSRMFTSASFSFFYAYMVFKSSMQVYNFRLIVIYNMFIYSLSIV